MYQMDSAAISEFVRQRKYFIAGIAATLACVYLIEQLRSRNRKPPGAGDGESRVVVEKTEVVEQVAIVDGQGKKDEEGALVATTVTTTTTVTEDKPEAPEDKKKRKKEKLKKTVIEGVNLVIGDSAGKFVESIIEISEHAKISGIEAFVKSGKLGKLFSQDVVPVLKSKLQKKKFPAIVGTTDSPIGDLHYEFSGITLESFDVDPSLQCDITDGSEALQIKLMISEAKLRNIAWKCGTAKFKEKGTANAEITKGQCVFRISLDKSHVIPKLSISHCSIDLQQFTLELKGSKASWMYNFMTTLFNNKIKTKLKEKIDKVLTKKCRQFEDKINFAAARLLSIFGDKKEKSGLVEGPLTSNKKCFLYHEDGSELECVMIDLNSVANVDDLKERFFDELGLDLANVRMKFKDRTATLVSISKSTTLEQLVQHAHSLHFYRETFAPSTPPALPHAPSTLSYASLPTHSSSEGSLLGSDTDSPNLSRMAWRDSPEVSKRNSMGNYDSLYLN